MPTKQDLGTSLGFFFEISDKHPNPFYMGVPPRPRNYDAELEFLGS